ncbi:hypothetical protein OQA88_9161 [Cercophora sp. LCS_1]
MEQPCELFPVYSAILFSADWDCEKQELSFASYLDEAEAARQHEITMVSRHEQFLKNEHERKMEEVVAVSARQDANLEFRKNKSRARLDRKLKLASQESELKMKERDHQRHDMQECDKIRVKSERDGLALRAERFKQEEDHEVERIYNGVISFSARMFVSAVVIAMSAWVFKILFW